MTGVSAKGRGALEVIIFEEARFRGSQMFTSAEVTMGSDPGVMIRLDDPNISPCHAALRFDGEICAVENYDILVGTLVNGEAIERQEITSTDEIQVGRFRLRINVHRADATPTPVSVRPPARPVAPHARPALVSPPAASAPVSTAHVATPAPPSTIATVRPAPGLPSPGASVRKPAASAPAPVPKPAPPPPPPRPAAPVAKPVAVPMPPAPPPAPRPTSTVSATAGRQTSSRATATVAAAPAAPPAPQAPIEPPRRQPEPAPMPPPAAPRPPATGRTATQPIASRFAEARTESVSPGRGLAVATEDAARARPLSSPLPLPLFGNDDDDDDALFEPSFSLFENLRASGTSSHKHSAVEVVRFRHGCILNLRHLHRGEKLRLHGVRKPLGRCSGPGGFVFQRDALPANIAITHGGQPLDDASWRQNVDKRGGIALDPATQVLFPLPSGEGILVHLVPAAAPLPKSTWRPRLTKLMVVMGAISVVVHLIVFAILGLASLVRRDYIADNKEGRFARIALKEIELEPPAPPPKHEKKKAKAEPSQTATAEATPRVVTHLPRTRAPTPPQTQSTATAQKLLSALGGLSAGPKPMSATAMSNLDAAGPVRGGGFKVSGAIGKLPGDSLRLASAGSGMGRLDTKSSNDVGKDLGRVLGRAPTGQVRAQVTAKPNLMKIEGHLDRGEIQKVINAHIHELQGCFERQLIVSPNLAGKVTFEWVIGISGAVTVVKIKASTLSSNEATSCMQAAVHRWQFPAPSGGQVTVIYPIALANSGT